MTKKQYSGFKKLIYCSTLASLFGISMLSPGCATVSARNVKNTPVIAGNLDNTGVNVTVTFNFYNLKDLGNCFGSFCYGFFRPLRKEFWTSLNSESWAAPFYGRNYAADHRAETIGDDSRYLLLAGGLVKILFGKHSGNNSDKSETTATYDYPQAPAKDSTSAPLPESNPQPAPHPQPSGGYHPGQGGNVGK